MSQQNCSFCNKSLHSIITVPFGNDFICRDCSAFLLPLLNSIANGIIERSSYFKGDVREFVISEIEDYFMGVMNEPNTILMMLK